MKNKKRLLALAMTASMAATMMVGCGSKTAGNGSGKGSEAASNGSAAGITIYNSKTEIQSQIHVSEGAEDTQVHPALSPLRYLRIPLRPCYH